MEANDRAILERRAQALARPLEQPPDAEQETVVTFRRGARYAVPAAAVQTVRPLPRLEPLVGAPALVAGVVAIRGEVVVVIDPAALFGAVVVEPARTIVVVTGGALTAGLLADDVTGIGTITRATLERPPDSLSRLAQAVGLGLDAHAGLVLEPMRLFDDIIGIVSGRSA